jgi:hypothetical protein
MDTSNLLAVDDEREGERKRERENKQSDTAIFQPQLDLSFT